MIETLRTRIVPRLAAVEAGLAEARGLAVAGALVAPARLLAAAHEVEGVAEDEFRRLSHLLHPSIVRAGLLPALHSLLAQQPDDPPVGLSLPPADAEPVGRDLSPASVLAAYRIIEAALHNARRHAPGAAVQVAITRPLAGGVAIAVHDDGPGFVPSADAWGAGFATIDSRVRLAGGSWSVEAAPGAGTCVRATLPPAAAGA